MAMVQDQKRLMTCLPRASNISLFCHASVYRPVIKDQRACSGLSLINGGGTPLAGFSRLHCDLAKNLAIETSWRLIFVRHDYSGFLSREIKTKHKVKTMELVNKPIEIPVNVAEQLMLLNRHGPIA
ncbi:hypothetical protein ES703_122540 [subsurface metagenome]